MLRYERDLMPTMHYSFFGLIVSKVHSHFTRNSTSNRPTAAFSPRESIRPFLHSPKFICERRPNGTRNEHERIGGQQQEQKDLEKAC